jgi:hypothetical protein
MNPKKVPLGRSQRGRNDNIKRDLNDEENK